MFYDYFNFFQCATIYRGPTTSAQLNDESNCKKIIEDFAKWKPNAASGHKTRISNYVKEFLAAPMTDKVVDLDFKLLAVIFFMNYYYYLCH